MGFGTRYMTYNRTASQSNVQYVKGKDTRHSGDGVCTRPSAYVTAIGNRSYCPAWPIGTYSFLLSSVFINCCDREMGFGTYHEILGFGTMKLLIDGIP